MSIFIELLYSWPANLKVYLFSQQMGLFICDECDFFFFFSFFWSLLGSSKSKRWLIFLSSKFTKHIQYDNVVIFISFWLTRFWFLLWLHTEKLNSKLLLKKVFFYDGAETVCDLCFGTQYQKKHISCTFLPHCHPVLHFPITPPVHTLSILIFSLFPTNNNQSCPPFLFLLPPMSNSPIPLIALQTHSGHLS